MKMRTIFVASFGFFSLLFSLLFAAPVAAAELRVEQNALEQALRAPVSIRRVDSRATAAGAASFAAFTNQVIDINRAQMRESSRLKRVTYLEELELDVPLMLDRSRPRRAIDSSPAKVWVRRGPLYHALLKHKDTSPQVPMAEELLIERARKFLVANRLVRSTGRDRLARPNVMTRFISEDGGEKDGDFDYVVQQDVSFTRVVDNLPVINSQIIVGVVPDSHEVVKVLVRNWPALARQETARIESHMKRSDSRAVLQEMEENLRSSAGKYASAHVAELFPCWYQTQEYLLPAVAFVVDLRYDDSTRDHAQVSLYNPLGSSRMFREAKELGKSPDYPWK